MHSWIFKGTLSTQSAPLKQHKEASVDLSQISLFPSVRRLLQIYNINPKDIKPAGPKGRILKGDVMKYISDRSLSPSVNNKREATEAVPVPASSLKNVFFEDLPISNMRKVIAERLTSSKKTTPHSYMQREIPIDKLLDLRKFINSTMNQKLSVNDFIIKGVAHCLHNSPKINVIFNKKTNTAESQKTVDISVAVAIEGGLITPIVFNADHKTLFEINDNVKQLAEKARKGTLQIHEFQGGSLTISNLGMYGVTQFTAVINPPQGIILSIGGSTSKLVVDQLTEKLYKETVITITLNFDHRVIDESDASQFLEDLENIFSDPKQLIL